MPEFMCAAFPPSWGGLASRILETGASFTSQPVSWIPRVSRIPLTTKTSKGSALENDLASVFFRLHDCIHQLWGVPWHSQDRKYYKRVQMAGEVAVLALTEFYYADLLCKLRPDLRTLIEARGAVHIYRSHLREDLESTVIRLDLWLHRMVNPYAPSPAHAAWITDYRNMLKVDRDIIDSNLHTAARLNWTPEGAPTCAIPQHLDGLEISLWMVRDFKHQLKTTTKLDLQLARFNEHRRNLITIPKELI